MNSKRTKGFNLRKPALLGTGVTGFVFVSLVSLGFASWALQTTGSGLLNINSDSEIIQNILSLDKSVYGSGVSQFKIYTADDGAFENDGEISTTQGLLSYYFEYDIDAAMSRGFVVGGRTMINASLSLNGDKFSFLRSDVVLSVSFNNAEIVDSFLTYDQSGKRLSLNNYSFSLPSTSAEKYNFSLTFSFGNSLLAINMASAPSLSLEIEVVPYAVA